MSGTRSKPMTPARLRALIQVAREMDVAEMSVGSDGSVEFKLFREHRLPGAALGDVQEYVPGAGADSEVPGDLRAAFETHLDARSPSRAEEDERINLMWST